VHPLDAEGRGTASIKKTTIEDYLGFRSSQIVRGVMSIMVMETTFVDGHDEVYDENDIVYTKKVLVPTMANIPLGSGTGRQDLPFSREEEDFCVSHQLKKLL
jgi:hypothetical protein